MPNVTKAKGRITNIVMRCRGVGEARQTTVRISVSMKVEGHVLKQFEPYLPVNSMSPDIPEMVGEVALKKRIFPGHMIEMEKRSRVELHNVRIQNIRLIPQNEEGLFGVEFQAVVLLLEQHRYTVHDLGVHIFPYDDFLVSIVEPSIEKAPVEMAHPDLG